MAEKIKLAKNRLINGIIGFGIAHILYIFTFLRLSNREFQLWQLILGLFLLITIYRAFVYSPSMNKVLTVASGLYAFLLATLMVVVIQIYCSNIFSNYIPLVALGGVFLFIASDTVIAYTEFKGTIPYSSQFITTTYVISQLLLQGTIILIEGG